MEWIGVPWIDQETPCQLMCDAADWNSVPRAATFWYTQSSPLHVENHALTHVITADLPLHHAIGDKDTTHYQTAVQKL